MAESKGVRSKASRTANDEKLWARNTAFIDAEDYLEESNEVGANEKNDDGGGPVQKDMTIPSETSTTGAEYTGFCTHKGCSSRMSRSKLSGHTRKAHVEEEQIARFGSVMGIPQRKCT